MAAATGELTVLVAAHNAGATIERALRSILPDRCRAIVLADDHSTDDTVDRARAAVGPSLRVVRSLDPGGVAAARQQALDAVDTPYAAWLDADDEWIPGRAGRLVALLDAGCDVATESIDLHDGPSGNWIGRLDAPSCLRKPGGPLRLFERNLLPGDTQVAFRAQTYRRAGGYDVTLCGPESFDLLLRALRRGATIGFGSDVGYRMYAYPGSLSRNLARQRGSLAAALRKHDYEDVRRLYVAAGLSARLAAWALVLMAQFREEPFEALRYLDEACPEGTDGLEVLEPDGPWPFAEGWRRAFHRGTILLSLGQRDEEAARSLRRAESLGPTPEGANNLGVALARLGRRDDAGRAFAQAVARFDGYADAAVNSRALRPDRITTHPLRRGPARRDYQAATSPAA
jgi:glycosyltransferase involved in cell wall biosynthesis